MGDIQVNRQLKPCPFCGSDKVMVRDNSGYFDAKEKAYNIVCRECKAFYGNSRAYGSREGTIRLWNRRAKCERGTDENQVD